MQLLYATDFSLLLKSIVIMLLTFLPVGLALKRLHQPYFVACIIAGILLGPHIFRIFTDADTISAIGELGLLIQMFFIGTKIEIKTLAQNVKKPLIGVAVQLLLGFLFILVAGSYRHWSGNGIVLFTFIITLSSSAIILEYLEKNKEINTPLGTLTSGILVLQDFLPVPMLLTLNFMGQKSLSFPQLLPPVVAVFIFALLLKEILTGKKLNFHFPAGLKEDHEAQVFVGLLLCFGFDWITHMLHLSAASGALIAGLVIANSDSTRWLESKLIPFRVFFLSLFFFSIGLQINLDFLISHRGLILLTVAVIFFVNNIVNSFVFRLLKVNMRDSIYAGALLSQIGEFSLVLCIVSKTQGLVDDFWYRLTLTVISATMLSTAVWINIIRTLIYKQPGDINRPGRVRFLTGTKPGRIAHKSHCKPASLF